jgi:hypothetical protein
MDFYRQFICDMSRRKKEKFFFSFFYFIIHLMSITHLYYECPQFIHYAKCMNTSLTLAHIFTYFQHPHQTYTHSYIHTCFEGFPHNNIKVILLEHSITIYNNLLERMSSSSRRRKDEKNKRNLYNNCFM